MPSRAGQEKKKNKQQQHSFVCLIKTGFLMAIIMIHIKWQLRKQDVTAGFAQNMT